MIFPKKEMIQLYFLATGKLVSFCLIKKSFFFRSKRKNTVCAPSYQGHKPSWRHREIPQNKVNEKLFKNRISSPICGCRRHQPRRQSLFCPLCSI